MSVLLLLLSGCAGEEEKGDCPPYLVHITAGNVTGSGIIYSMEDGWISILTAAHVVEDMPTARPAGSGGAADPGAENDRGAGIVFCDGEKVSCREIIVSDLADLAMLRVPVSKFTKARVKNYSSVPVDKESFDAMRIGDACTAVGYGAQGDVLEYSGSVKEPWIYMEDYGQYMIWADTEIRSGMSGGGLFDADGCLIGILSGGSEDGELAAVPYSLILQFMAMPR